MATLNEICIWCVEMQSKECRSNCPCCRPIGKGSKSALLCHVRQPGVTGDCSVNTFAECSVLF